MQCRPDLNPAGALDCIKSKNSQCGIHAGLTVLHQIWEDRWCRTWLKSGPVIEFIFQYLLADLNTELILISYFTSLCYACDFWPGKEGFTFFIKTAGSVCLSTGTVLLNIFVATHINVSFERGCLEWITRLSCTCMKHFKQNSKCQPLTKRGNWPLKA